MLEDFRLNPFVSQVGFFDGSAAVKKEKKRRGLNPFVSQVGFFLTETS